MCVSLFLSLILLLLLLCLFFVYVIIIFPHKFPFSHFRNGAVFSVLRTLCLWIYVIGKQSDRRFPLELLCKLLWFSYNFFYMFIFFGGVRVKFDLLFSWQTFIKQKKHHLITCVKEIMKNHMPNPVSSKKWKDRKKSKCPQYLHSVLFRYMKYVLFITMMDMGFFPYKMWVINWVCL